MTALPLRAAIFPVTLLVFAAVGVRYFNALFTTNTRWLVLALLMAWLLARRQFLLPLRAQFSLILLLDILWCLSTTLWSQAPELSLMKGVAFGLTSWTLTAAGMAWVQQRPGKSAMAYLLPILVLALFAGLVGASGEVWSPEPHPERYRGLAGNPNYLGILVAMALPYALYHAFGTRQRRQSPTHRWIAAGIVTSFAALSWWSASRASVLCTLFIGTFFILAAERRRSIRAVVLSATFALTAVIAVPAVLDALNVTLIVRDDPNGDPFGSRRQPWEVSYQAALGAGALGLGYGVSAGIRYISGGDAAFWLHLTANDYGREKGNAQLAVWEETGLIGLVLYGILLGEIILFLVSGFRRAATLDARLQIGLLAGALVGILAQSGFEAWWTSPGSVESAYFWSTLGVATELIRQQRSAVQRTTMARYPMLSPESAR